MEQKRRKRAAHHFVDLCVCVSQALTMGGSYKIDPSTTVAGKISSAGTLGLAYKQNVTPVATLLLAAEVDTKDWASDTHKFGIGVTLSG